MASSSGTPIVVGCDGSDGSPAAIAALGELLGGARVVVVHVWQRSPSCCCTPTSGSFGA